MRLLVVLAIAGCTADPAPAPDAAIAVHTCAASFTGNFDEASSSEANCPAIHDATIALSLQSQILGASLAISIDLGAMPSAGTYNAETVASWTARAVQLVGSGACVYSAGTDVVPHGSFVLDLDATTRHGMFTMIEYVLDIPGTDCGDDDTETVQVSF